jgi:uncharacterized protein (TIGR02145 family)
MNRIFTVLSAVVFTATLWAQAPQKFSYQAVVRNANNELVANKQVGMKISLLQTSESGTAVYVETHTPTSNANGLVSIAIGGGTKVSGDFATINWANGPYFVKTETDPAGGTSYSLTTTSQLLSVPYALYAKTAESIIGGSLLPSGGTNGQIITNCDGVPTWTTGGICPGKIASLNCAGVSLNGSLNNGVAASNVSFAISYSGGNGGPYSAQSISSTGVTGLTASLQAGTFVNGNGSLTFTVSGTPTSVGNALFSFNIAGQVCSISMVVQAQPQQPTSGYGPNITDAESNTYKTVYIGTQQWMAENLKVTKYNDGTAIQYVTDNTQWQNNTTGAWAYYNNDAANNAKYGKLYNWYAVSPTTNGNKNVCPTGWHVPTDAEWTVLTDYLGASVAGVKMKEVGTTSWISPNTDATNTSLFTGVPGGSRNNFGNYSNIGNGADWWSSSEYSADEAWYRNLYYLSNGVNRFFLNKNFGVSIRCLKD